MGFGERNDKDVLEGLHERVSMLEKRVDKLEYKVEKILSILEKLSKKKDVNDCFRAFIGDIEEFRYGDKLIVRHGIIYVSSEEFKDFNPKAIEDDMNCYVVEDNIEGKKYYGFMPKEALKYPDNEVRLSKVLRDWYAQYGRNIIKKIMV